MKYKITLLVPFIFIVFVSSITAAILLPNDPLFDSWNESIPEGNNWGQEFIRLASAWSLETGTYPIAVVDGGFNIAHEDLKGNIDFYNSDQLDFLENKKQDDNAHGTHVAGIIGANGNSGIGIAGIEWKPNLRLYNYTFASSASIFNSKRNSNSLSIVSMIRSAIDKGAKVINLSAGYCLETNEECAKTPNKARAEDLDIFDHFFKAIYKLAKERNRDILFIVAAGNNSDKIETVSPARTTLELESVLAVANIKIDGSLSSSSNYSATNTVAAPGTNIYSTLPNNQYGYMSGTSMAAPFVSGLAGLIWSRAEELGKTLTATEVKQLIIDGAVNGGKYAEDPNGNQIPIINAYESLKLLEPASCGDGIINGTEQCDGSELGEATCNSIMGESFVGSLSCNSSCNYDTSGCYVPEPSSSVSWGAFGGNASRNGQSEYIGPQNNAIKWQNSEVSNWQMPFFGIVPLVGKDNTVYLANQNQGKLFGLNATTGATEWSFPSNDSLGTALSLPAISSDGNIYIGSDTGNFYAINTNGTEKWRYTINPLQQIGGSPVTDPNSKTIYFTTVYGSSKNTLYSLNPDGSLKWRFDADKPSYPETASPAIGSRGTVYMSFWEDGLYALNPDDGSIKWKNSESAVSSPVVGADGTIYVIISRPNETGNLLLALNSDGTEKWTYSGVDRMIKPAVSGDGIIFAKGRHNPQGQYIIEFWAIKSNGTLKWKNTAVGYAYQSSPAIGADGTVYIATTKGLYALDSNDGSIKWYKENLCCSAPAIGSNGWLYYGTYDNVIYAFGE